MLRSILEELRHLDTSRKALRSFGLVVGGVLLGIAVLVLWRRAWTPDGLTTTLGAIGLGLVLLGLVIPTVLRPLYRVWMGLAFVLGYIMTRVLLTIVFYGIVTPTGLIFRALGKDLLNRRPDPDAPTYWVEKTYTTEGPERLEKYY